MQLDSGLLPVVLATAAGLIGVALLLWRRRSVADTTLLIPWGWAMLSVCLIALCGIVIALFGRSGAAWTESLRVVAAGSAFCPGMAVLGAKRPHDKAWQLIVASLWVILALPALRQLLVKPGQPLEISGLPSWFLAILIGLNLINTLPTRFWPSAVLVAAGQIGLFNPHLPVSIPIDRSAAWLGGFWLLVGGLVLATMGWPPKRQVVQAEDRLWLDFRDSFGTLWSLRMAERINAAAAMYQWDVHLGWNGFQCGDAGGRIPPDVASRMHRTIRNLFRRFVSRRWIAQRLKNQAQGDK